MALLALTGNRIARKGDELLRGPDDLAGTVVDRGEHRSIEALRDVGGGAAEQADRRIRINFVLQAGSVGEADGNGVGTRDGCAVGFRVGSAEGPVDGFGVGLMVGSRVGRGVGNTEGGPDGGGS
jgi:hypothetical protein